VVARNNTTAAQTARRAAKIPVLVGDTDLVLTSFNPARENQFAYAKTQITSGQRLSVISENWSK
jgi:hypothetical protein